MNETTPYFYVKNLMGDICEIVDKNGESVATYHYDAWGNLLKSEGDATILQLNPFTYRGYIYDSETKLYYLQTRYYNPEWNRFINADTNLDTQTSIVGTNVFTYSDNKPVMLSDPNGGTPLNETQKQQYLDGLIYFLMALTGVTMSGLASAIDRMTDYSFKFSKNEKYGIYSVEIFASEHKWYSSTEYVIVTYGAKVSDWWHMIDTVRDGIALYNKTGDINNLLKFVEILGMTNSMTGLPALLAFAVTLGINDYISELSNILITIEKNMRGMKGDQFYIFNWSVVRNSWTLFSQFKTDYIYVYSKWALL